MASTMNAQPSMQSMQFMSTVPQTQTQTPQQPRGGYGIGIGIDNGHGLSYASNRTRSPGYGDGSDDAWLDAHGLPILPDLGKYKAVMNEFCNKMHIPHPIEDTIERIIGGGYRATLLFQYKGRDYRTIGYGKKKKLAIYKTYKKLLLLPDAIEKEYAYALMTKWVPDIPDMPFPTILPSAMRNLSSSLWLNNHSNQCNNNNNNMDNTQYNNVDHNTNSNNTNVYRTQAQYYQSQSAGITVDPTPKTAGTSSSLASSPPGAVRPPSSRMILPLNTAEAMQSAGEQQSAICSTITTTAAPPPPPPAFSADVRNRVLTATTTTTTNSAIANAPAPGSDISHRMTNGMGNGMTRNQWHSNGSADDDDDDANANANSMTHNGRRYKLDEFGLPVLSNAGRYKVVVKEFCQRMHCRPPTEHVTLQPMYCGYKAEVGLDFRGRHFVEYGYGMKKKTALYKAYRKLIPQVIEKRVALEFMMKWAHIFTGDVGDDNTDGNANTNTNTNTNMQGNVMNMNMNMNMNVNWNMSISGDARNNDNMSRGMTAMNMNMNTGMNMGMHDMNSNESDNPNAHPKSCVTRWSQKYQLCCEPTQWSESPESTSERRIWMATVTFYGKTVCATARKKKDAETKCYQQIVDWIVFADGPKINR